MTRRATAADIPLLVSHISEYRAVTPGGIDFDYLAGWLADRIDDPAFIILKHGDGSAACVVAPSPWNGEPIASEVWWLSRDGCGAELLRSLEREAKCAGANVIGLVSEVEMRGETVARYLERKGYRRQELVLRKEL